MNDFKRCDLEFLAEAKGRARYDDVWNYLRQATTEMRRLKDVFEDAFDIDPSTLIRIDTERAEAKVQRPDVIKAKDMICVAVCDEHRIELLKTIAKCLLTKIG